MLCVFFTASHDVTTTFDYDLLGCITRCYTAQGYSDYIYEGETEWLARETWHSYVSGQSFDLLRYHYTNGSPSHVEVAQTMNNGGNLWYYETRYFQANWHGDLVRYIGAVAGVGVCAIMKGMTECCSMAYGSDRATFLCVLEVC